jgi:site-specific recombinase XerD
VNRRIDSATADWQRTLKGVFEQAGIPDGHAHRSRDMFAVGLLQAGVPMERVSVLLGQGYTKKSQPPTTRKRLHNVPDVPERVEEALVDV